ncbi:LysR family transcriptional regulator [Magnetospira sp. QH-2]|uniref:LysR family transcriptional regulator n=1 Tax=Magnetospira sp. (strain QH-2) TaxID=1288970 RepID=UPI0003E81809|nr:LysR family transcriptional regulator [Magnetospira sp. QH-2]CCQ72469.1 HTH transcriptional regulator, LysR [Magnetospira sp. QH-2]
MSKHMEGTREFIEVVHQGSFTAAANKLGVAKSFVSRHVKALEDRLGLQLMIRTTRGFTLTEAGEVYFNQCRQIFQDLEELEKRIADQNTTPRGPIRVTVAGAFGEDYIAPLVAEFLSDHPEVSVHLEFTNRTLNLIENNIDIAFRTGFVVDGPFIRRKLCAYPLITVASREYLDRNSVPESPQDLSRHNCLVGTLTHWRFDRDDDFQEWRIHGNWRSNNGRALIAAAESGLGIAQVPLFYARESLEQGRLVPVLEPYLRNKVPIWALQPQRVYMPTRVRLLLDYLYRSCHDIAGE